MSLYRTYRPKTFGDVVGQDHIVHTLTQAVKLGRLSHAYLLSGPRGTGKTTIARILARTMLTAGIDDPTLRKHVEEALDQNNLVDLLEIDAASNRGIDDIKNLLEKLQFAPVVCKAKVHIIDEVHMLSKDAFNALLKTLEEPPPYAYFILATTELHKVPVTIQSRCQRFAFRQIPEEEIVQRLQLVADQEKIAADRGALRAIARRSDGIMRDALALLDQLRTLGKITEEDVAERTGETGREIAEQVRDALDNGDEASVLALIARIEERALPFDQVLRELLTLTRETLHAAIAERRDATAPLERLRALLQAVRDVRTAPVPGLTVESALLSLLLSVTAPVKPLATPAPTPLPPADIHPTVKKTAHRIAEKTAVAAASSSAVVSAEELSLPRIRELWHAVTKAVEPASVRMSLKDATVDALDGTTLTLAFSSNFHRQKVAATEASRAVEAVLEEFLLHPVRLRCTVESEKNALPTANPELVNLAEAASEIF